MARKRYGFSITAILLMISIFPAAGWGAKLNIDMFEAKYIIAPTDSRDIRILLKFDLPEKLSSPGVVVDFAVLRVKAEVRGGAMGQIDIYPIMTDWTDKASVTWNDPWNEAGGDYSNSYLSSNYTLLPERGFEEISIDITEIVRAWTNGELANHGIVLLASKEISARDVKHTVDHENAGVTIFYSRNINDIKRSQ